jgi:hypothetical protein
MDVRARAYRDGRNSLLLLRHAAIHGGDVLAAVPRDPLGNASPRAIVYASNGYRLR